LKIVPNLNYKRIQTLIFAPWQRKIDKVVFHQIKVIDAGERVSVAKALMAK
jgi:hypothetical protein